MPIQTGKFPLPSSDPASLLAGISDILILKLDRIAKAIEDQNELLKIQNEFHAARNETLASKHLRPLENDK